MRKSCALLCVWLSFAVVSYHAQSQTFKGHRIGESFSDFLKAEPAIQEKLTYCQTTTPHQLSPDEIAKLSPEELRSRYGAWAKSFKQYLKIEANYNKPDGALPSRKDQELADYQSKCSGVMDAFAEKNIVVDGNGNEAAYANIMMKSNYSLVGQNPALLFSPIATSGTEVNEDNRLFQFEKGTLISFIQDLRADHTAAKADITNRIGISPTETTEQFHNAFGAEWTEVTTSWDNSAVHIELSMDGNPAYRSRPHFEIESQELHQKLLEYLRNLPKPLD